jgi:hypothetical protein
MISTRSPPKLKQTPTTRPELLHEWQRLYEELSVLYPKSRALQMVADRYKVSRATTIYHLFPDYKQSQKKRPSIKWSYEKQDPVIHEKRIRYKARYMAARYHISDLVRTTFKRAEPRQTMILEDLAYGVERICGIFFKPSTLLGLNERCKVKKGYPLFAEVSGYDQPHYRLSEEVKA